jgi:hypothetical protein
MRQRITFRESPGTFSAFMTFAVMMMITGCASLNILMVQNRLDWFIYLFVFDGVISVVVGCIVAWRMGTLFIPKRAPPYGPPPQGVDELVAMRAAGPMQCRYCETSLLPSMASCPKCGRRVF